MDNLLKNQGVNKDDIVNEILKDLPLDSEIEVELPSKGRFYTSKGPITISPLKYDDEKIILSNRKSKTDPINLIISRCTRGVDVSELLEMDKLYLLMKIREISYGENYTFDSTCPVCNAIATVTINLSERMLINYIPEGITDPREVLLPTLNKKAVVRFIRLKDEGYFKDEDLATNNLWRLVDSIDGYNDPEVVSKVIKGLSDRSLIDIKTLIFAIKRPDLGLQPEFVYSCGSCGAESRMEIPLTPSFFSLT